MQYTKDQSNISDTGGSNSHHFFCRADVVPKCKVNGNISQVQQVVASEKYPVDGKTHLAVMNKILEIRLPGPEASPSHIYGDVRAHRKEYDV